MMCADRRFCASVTASAMFFVFVSGGTCCCNTESFFDYFADFGLSFPPALVAAKMIRSVMTAA
jgi:hypothetical protein